jgi:hypothetical protein
MMDGFMPKLKTHLKYKLHKYNLQQKKRYVTNDNCQQCSLCTIKYTLCNQWTNSLKWWWGLCQNHPENYACRATKTRWVKGSEPDKEDPLAFQIGVWGKGLVTPTVTSWLHQSDFMGTYHSAILSLIAGLKGKGLVVCFCSSPMAL